LDLKLKKVFCLKKKVAFNIPDKNSTQFSFLSYFRQQLPGISTAMKNRLMGTITDVDTDLPVLALTFDDGPNPKYTPELLKLLKKYNVHATFFMVGQAASQNPELVRQVYENGHTIGNHSYHHKELPSLNIFHQIKELLMCRFAVRPYGSLLLRPPWGKQTNRSRLIASLLGYRVITWNLTGEDWVDHSPQWIYNHLAAKLRPGSIILLHDRIFGSTQKTPQYNRTKMLEAVELLLEMTKGTFKFVTIPQLLGSGNPHYVIWERL
jgi:peptidoglycan/xylan/chitin deacetylase (PgdA/CDA1 family)